MKIAISANSSDPLKPFSDRFGRCACFLITENGGTDWKTVTNPAEGAQGGAGTQVVQLLSDQGVDVVISGRYGPNAFSALQAGGIEAFLARSGSPVELVSKFQGGELEQATGPTGRGFHGGGRGRGGRW